MLKMEAMSCLTGRIIRGCKFGHIPFNSRQCKNDLSATNQNINRWLFNQQLHQQQKFSTKRRICNATPNLLSSSSSDFHNMPEYTLEDLKRRRYYGNKQRGSDVHVPKEFTTLLNRYAADPAYNVNFSRRDPLEVAEDSNPALAAHLRGVMESNNLFRKVYNIDFYNNRIVGEADSQRRPNYLDPKSVGYLLKLLREKPDLTAEQLDFLRNALIAMAHLFPPEQASFLKMFLQDGLLAPDILNYLQGLTKTIAVIPVKKKKLIQTFRDMLRLPNVWNNEYEITGKGNYDAYGYDKDGYDSDGFNRYSLDQDGFDREGYDRDGYDRDGYDSSGYDHEGYDRNGYNQEGLNRDGFSRYGYDKQGFIRQSETDPHLMRQVRLRILKAYKKRVETFLDRLQSIQMTGEKGDGYYEPWDLEMEWDAARALVDKAKLWRLKRLDLSKFEYNRGMEKYLSELQHSHRVIQEMERAIHAEDPPHSEHLHRRRSRTPSVSFARGSTLLKRNRHADLTLGKQKRTARKSMR